MSESKDFSWSDPSTCVIRPVYAVAVYVNPNSDVVIRQQNAMGDDHVVIVPHDRINALVDALQLARSEAEGS